jgi:hypothetical protein
MTKIKGRSSQVLHTRVYYSWGKKKILFCFCWAHCDNTKNPKNFFAMENQGENIPLKKNPLKRTKETTPKSHKIRLLWYIKGKRGPLKKKFFQKGKRNHTKIP